MLFHFCKVLFALLTIYQNSITAFLPGQQQKPAIVFIATKRNVLCAAICSIATPNSCEVVYLIFNFERQLERWPNEANSCEPGLLFAMLKTQRLAASLQQKFKYFFSILCLCAVTSNERDQKRFFPKNFAFFRPD